VELFEADVELSSENVWNYNKRQMSYCSKKCGSILEGNVEITERRCGIAIKL